MPHEMLQIASLYGGFCKRKRSKLRSKGERGISLMKSINFFETTPSMPARNANESSSNPTMRRLLVDLCDTLGGVLGDESGLLNLGLT